MGTKKIAIIAAIIIIGSGAGYAISPYFTESTINEPMPKGAIMPTTIVVNNNEDVDKISSIDDNMPDAFDNLDEVSTDVNVVGTDVTSMSDNMIPVSYAGTFIGVGDGIHDAGGRAYTIPLEDGNSVLRLEDFYSTNGPGLRVYLATDKTASDYLSLGDLKANRGNQNYQLSDDIDLEKYNHVLIWCEPFSVLFGSAQLYGQ